MGRQSSRADTAAIALAAERSVSVTPRQLERWRQAGAIPKPHSRSLGRGRGRTSWYEQSDLDYIVEFARRSAPRREHFAVVLWVLLDGHAVPAPCLRRAYRTYFARVSDWASPSRFRRNRRGPLATAARRGFSGTQSLYYWEPLDAPRTATQYVETVHEVMGLAFLEGEQPTGEQAAELANAGLHLPALRAIDVQPKMDTESLAAFGRAVASSSLSALRHAAQTAPPELIQIAVAAVRNNPEIGSFVVATSGYGSAVYAHLPLVMLTRMRSEISVQTGMAQLNYEALYELLLAGEII